MFVNLFINKFSSSLSLDLTIKRAKLKYHNVFHEHAYEYKNQFKYIYIYIIFLYVNVSKIYYLDLKSN